MTFLIFLIAIPIILSLTPFQLFQQMCSVHLANGPMCFNQQQQIPQQQFQPFNNFSQQQQFQPIQ
jgi:hypothetical protein